MITELDHETMPRDKNQRELMELILVRVDRIKSQLSRYLSHDHHLESKSAQTRHEHRIIGYMVGDDLAQVGTLFHLLHLMEGVEVAQGKMPFWMFDGKDEMCAMDHIWKYHAPTLTKEKAAEHRASYRKVCPLCGRGRKRK